MEKTSFANLEKQASELLEWFPEKKFLGNNGKLLHGHPTLVSKCRKLEIEILALLNELSDYRFDSKNSYAANMLTLDLTQRRTKLSYVSDVITRTKVN